MKSNIIRTLFDRRVLRTGDRQYDGTIFIGCSEDTARPIFTTAKPNGLAAIWGRAVYLAGVARTEKLHGKSDWRLPLASELDLLYKSRTLIGGFEPHQNQSDRDWYWSAAEYPGCYSEAWARSFSSGQWACQSKAVPSAFRLVRG